MCFRRNLNASSSATLFKVKRPALSKLQNVLPVPSVESEKKAHCFHMFKGKQKPRVFHYLTVILAIILPSSPRFPGVCRAHQKGRTELDLVKVKFCTETAYRKKFHIAQTLERKQQLPTYFVIDTASERYIFSCRFTSQCSYI